MFTRIITSLVILLLVVGNYAVASEPKSSRVENKLPNKSSEIESLFGTDDYRNVNLSPDGKHIALIRNQNEVPVLVIVEVATMQAVNQIYFAKKDAVGSYIWANNERLLISLQTKQRNKEQKAYYGEIYSINIDEDKGKFIFGVRSLVHRGRIKRNVTDADYEKHLAHPKIISTLKDDPEHIIISTSQYGGKGMWVFKLNIYKGSIETLAQVDGHRVDHKSTKLWYLEDKQELWFKTAQSASDVVFGQYDFSKNVWVKYNPKDITNKLSVIAYAKDQQKLIVSDYCGNDTISMCLFDPKTQELASLYSIDGYDVNWLYLDNENAPYAMSYFDEYPKIKVLDKSHDKAKILTELLAKFSGYEMNVKWSHEFEDNAIITLSNDIQPTLWYLFDGKKNKLSYVASSKKSVDVKKLHPQYSFKFNARDNTSLQGYLTLPKSDSKAAKAAVILVHGGPHLRDYWGFDPEVQLLSANGYAVVQVNFRGSQGFGWDFESAGFNQWGEDMQHDIIDGVNHLVNKGYIDKNRLCIMGASFGGYSALQSSILEPNLFKCAIASSGVYDLELLIDDNEFKEARLLTNRVGSQEIQVKHSPVHAVDKLQSPLLLAHGAKDDRTPLEQAEVLIEQLEKHNKNYQWFEFENEGHGLFNHHNRYKFYENVLQFLTKYNPAEGE